MKRNISLSTPCMGDEEWHAVKGPLLSGWVTQGPSVSQFEKLFAEAHSAPYAIATSSGTTALHLALVAAGIGPGDEVIVPSFTWVATANAVVYCGATPVLADIDPKTYNISLEAISKVLSSKTKAVIPVHLFGLCADIGAIRAIVPPNVFILEDAACAAGARYGSHYPGMLGDAAVFSFHPRKLITTGEGGMVLTRNAALAEAMNTLRNHGALLPKEAKPYFMPEFHVLGFNYRMTDMQGAIGVIQTRKMPGFLDERARWAKWYGQQLADISWLTCPAEPEDGKHGWQAFVVYVGSSAPTTRNAIMELLLSHGIATRPGTHAVHTLHYYRERFGTKAEDCPNAAACANQTIALPLHNNMSEADYMYVVEKIRSIA